METLSKAHPLLEECEVSALVFAQKLLSIYPEASFDSFLFLATLFQSSLNGHLCLTLKDKNSSEIKNGYDALPEDLKRYVCVFSDNSFYLRRHFEAKELFIKHYRRIMASTCSLQVDFNLLKEKLTNLPLSLEQADAIIHIFQRPLTIISGGPGTGKSLIAKYVAQLFLHFFPTSRLIACAPTGKAASNLRLSIDSNCEVKTLHRTLSSPAYEYDLILVDEASMVDARCMSELFSSLKMGARLVLLGDKDQLPPVEAGNFFQELAEMTSVQLKTSFRQKTDEIRLMIDQIRQGDLPLCEKLVSPQKIISWAKEKRKSSFCLLTPLQKGPYGTLSLNERFYEECFVKEKEKSLPLLIEQNDLALDLANGDLATFFPEEGFALLADGRKIERDHLPRHSLAYLLTIHKSQGSEYDEVAILIPEKGLERFGRELLYTAVTRAKKKATLFVENEATLKGLLQRTIKR